MIISNGTIWARVLEEKQSLSTAPQYAKDDNYSGNRQGNYGGIVSSAETAYQSGGDSDKQQSTENDNYYPIFQKVLRVRFHREIVP